VQGKQALVVFTALKVIPMVAKADNNWPITIQTFRKGQIQVIALPSSVDLFMWWNK
jgi:hypothetical protein